MSIRAHVLKILSLRIKAVQDESSLVLTLNPWSIEKKEVCENGSKNLLAMPQMKGAKLHNRRKSSRKNPQP
jgi:hypothetical protein